MSIHCWIVESNQAYPESTWHVDSDGVLCFSILLYSHIHAHWSLLLHHPFYLFSFPSHMHWHWTVLHNLNHGAPLCACLLQSLTFLTFKGSIWILLGNVYGCQHPATDQQGTITLSLEHQNIWSLRCLIWIRHQAVCQSLAVVHGLNTMSLKLFTSSRT
jgi:hypothetical protein